MKNHQFLRCHSRGAIKKIMKVLLRRSSARVLEKSKVQFDFQLVKQTDSFIPLHEKDLCCSSRAYNLHALPRCSLGILEDGILKELGII